MQKPFHPDCFSFTRFYYKMDSNPLFIRILRTRCNYPGTEISTFLHLWRLYHSSKKKKTWMHEATVESAFCAENKDKTPQPAGGNTRMADWSSGCMSWVWHVGCSQGHLATGASLKDALSEPDQPEARIYLPPREDKGGWGSQRGQFISNAHQVSSCASPRREGEPVKCQRWQATRENKGILFFFFAFPDMGCTSSIPTCWAP